MIKFIKQYIYKIYYILRTFRQADRDNRLRTTLLNVIGCLWLFARHKQTGIYRVGQ